MFAVDVSINEIVVYESALLLICFMAMPRSYRAILIVFRM